MCHSVIFAGHDMMNVAELRANDIHYLINRNNKKED